MRNDELRPQELLPRGDQLRAPLPKALQLQIDPQMRPERSFHQLHRCGEVRRPDTRWPAMVPHHCCGARSAGCSCDRGAHDALRRRQRPAIERLKSAAKRFIRHDFESLAAYSSAIASSAMRRQARFRSSFLVATESESVPTRISSNTPAVSERSRLALKHVSNEAEESRPFDKCTPDNEQRLIHLHQRSDIRSFFRARCIEYLRKNSALFSALPRR